MNVVSSFNKGIAWAARNERKLGAGLFAFGFLTDFFTFGLLPVSIVNYIFLAYLVLAAVSILGAYLFASSHAMLQSPRRGAMLQSPRRGAMLQSPRRGELENKTIAWWKRALSVICPLGAQYAFGGVLSGFVVFYTAHSFILASWPFLIFLLAIYVGNEYFRMYKHYLIFQTTIFFFSLYAYSIFALPLLVGALGPLVFAGSSAVALIVFAVFLWLLSRIDRARIMSSMRQIVITNISVIVLISGAYFSGFIPPIPLALAQGGIYHSLTKTGDVYIVQSEEPVPWWRFGVPLVHHTSGTPLYAYSAVAAPVRFGGTIIHRWERKSAAGDWITESRITFPITGGREGGYRGYSIKEKIVPGSWRVSVETANGQVIGRVRFDVEAVAMLPELREIPL